MQMTEMKSLRSRGVGRKDFSALDSWSQNLEGEREIIDSDNESFSYQAGDGQTMPEGI